MPAARRRRRLGALGAAALALAGCHTVAGPAVYMGLGVADDAKAAQIGRIALDGGGKAADAAVAMALTLAVTLPSRAGLGGGGLCLIHDPATKAVRTLDFLPESALPGRSPLPGFLRGLYALHAAYGKQRWEQALGGAESLAAVGTPVSRQLALDLRADAGRLATDSGARRLFLSAAGQPLGEGEMLAQPELAATLRAVRQRGVGAFYGSAGTGSIGGTVARGLGFEPATLAGTQAAWRGTVEVETDNDIIHFPDRRSGGDGGLAGAWQAGLAAGDGGWQGALVGALGPGTAAGAAPAAVFAVVDPDEQAVACVLTLGGAFGSGRLVPETGFLAGGGAGAGGVGGPVLVVNAHQHTTLFAGAGAANGAGEGGRSAEAAVLSVLHASAVSHMAIPQSVVAPRAAPAPGGGMLSEPGAAALGRVAAVSCLYSRTTGDKVCEGAADPRGSGLNFTVLK